MIFLPDTNAFSRYFRGDDASLIARFRAEWAHIRLSAVVLAELEYGATKSGIARYRKRLTQLMHSISAVEAWTAEDAAEYGRIRADLELRGIAIGAHDMQIAAQAIRLGAVCVTHNQRHLSRVKRLKVHDWQTMP